MSRVLFLVFVSCGVCVSNVFSNELVFYDDYDSAVLERINTFRLNPLEYARKLNISQEELVGIWGEDGYNYLSQGLDFVSVDNLLNLLAKQHLEDMFYNTNFSHLFSFGITPEEMASQLGYDSLMIGESIVFLCFENYISPIKALEIMLNYLFRDALLQKTAEGAPVVFPYENIGIGFLGSTTQLEGKIYNIYALCLEFGLPKSSSENLLVGRIYLYDGNTKPLPEFGLRNVDLSLIDFSNNGGLVRKSKSFADGSYFMIKPFVSNIYIKASVPNGGKGPFFKVNLVGGVQRVDIPYLKDLDKF